MTRLGPCETLSVPGAECKCASDTQPPRLVFAWPFFKIGSIARTRVPIYSEVLVAKCYFCALGARSE